LAVPSPDFDTSGWTHSNSALILPDAYLLTYLPMRRVASCAESRPSW
jgi:hypothetical protein